MFDVVTFGSAVVDVFVETNLPEKGNFISYPAGSKILIKNLRFDIGGGGTNTAVAFSRFGLKTGFVGKIGDDENGRKILNLLKKEKVNFLGKISQGAMSGYSIVLDSKEKDRTILTFKAINNELSFEELPLRKIKTRWIYLTSLLEKSFETQLALAKRLNSRGTKIAFNPSDYLIKNKNLSPFLKICEVVIMNKEEALLLSKSKTLKQSLMKIHSLGPKIVVVTDKDKKISAYDGEKEYTLIPHKIKVVERTGAGDAFGSGFIAGLIVGKPINECLELGLRESESVIKHIGAKNNLLRMKLR